MSETNKYLNLGCGSRYHPDWINIDISPNGPAVIQHDLSRGIPLPDASCDVVYHTAVLEHLRPADAAAFLMECFRVLKTGGIVRVGVPDLEIICQLYLSRLAAALNGDEAAAHDYDWIMLELYDQAVREKSGGGMSDYLLQNPLPNETFVYERIGEEGRQLVKALRQQDSLSKRSFPGFLRRLRGGLRSLPKVAKRRIPQWLLGANGKRALEIGRFRLAGEVHQWMYDRYSLARLLRLTGFHDPQLQGAGTSRIPNWTSFHLDTLPDGQAIKPDLFFMEAIKAEAPIHERRS
ncbi:MAG TPA: methyltransferase domain-containing protein [Anaerolineales bacterium]